MICSICSSNNTNVFYIGNIRNGKYPNFLKNQKIYECQDCKSKFLNKLLNYKDENYRKITNDSNDVNELKFLSKELNNQIKFFDLEKISTKTILDVGCGTGFLLDYLKPLTKKTYALEKNLNFINHLRKSGHYTYTDISEIDNESFDIVTCFNVIEHIDGVIDFIKSLHRIVKPNGYLIIETPNSDDYLIDLLGKSFKQFYYRTQHRNYFNEESLKNILKYSQINKYEFIYSQKYGIENLFNWVRNKKPGQCNSLVFEEQFNNNFKKIIEQNKASDHIIIKIKK